MKQRLGEQIILVRSINRQKICTQTFSRMDTSKATQKTKDYRKKTIVLNYLDHTKGFSNISDVHLYQARGPNSSVRVSRLDRCQYVNVHEIALSISTRVLIFPPSNRLIY